jgi:hypothetical protein
VRQAGCAMSRMGSLGRRGEQEGLPSIAVRQGRRGFLGGTTSRMALGGGVVLRRRDEDSGASLSGDGRRWCDSWW